METTSFNGVEVEWLGHASVKLKDSNGFTVYIDPWSEVMDAENEKADLIISTHDHFDHFDKKMIQALKRRGTIVVCTEDSEDDVPEDLEARFIQPNRSVKVKNRRIKGVHAYNIDKFREPDTPYHPKGFCTGVVFELDGTKFYHMSDTDNIPELEELDSDIDIAFVPIGGTYTMDQEEAVEAIKKFEPKNVVPIHFGQVDGTEADVEKFERQVRLETDSKPVVLKES
jgi:L-ascorbate metabolism protein UlaG (beta-lactamase superfamily)